MKLNNKLATRANEKGGGCMRTWKLLGMVIEYHKTNRPKWVRMSKNIQAK